MSDYHIGRAWVGHAIEDDCPCGKAPCGLVLESKRDPDCEQHKLTKTIRQGHAPEHCPARDE